MTFNINSKALEKTLAKVIPAVPSRTPLPVLEGLLLMINDNLLTITASDNDIILQVSIPVDAAADFSGVVPAKLFYDVVRSLGDTLIRFEVVSESRLRLKTDSGTYHLGLIDAKDFPDVPAEDDGKSFSIEGKSLRSAFDQSSFAISKEAMRPAMTGMLFEMSEDGLKFVATDGHRLVRFLNKDHKFDEPDQFVVPEKAIILISKLLNENPVNVHYSESHATFKFSDAVLITRLIASKFPDYNVVIPLENENTLTVTTHEIIAAVKRMLLFSSSNYQQVKLSVTENTLQFSAEDIDRGSNATESIYCVYTGQPMEIGFNTNYLNDIMTHVRSEKAVLQMSTPTKACVVLPEETNASEDVLMLLMPVRINN